MEEKFYWLGFSACPAIGPAGFKRILAEFKTAKAAWETPSPAMAGLIGKETAEKFEKFRKKFSIEDYIKELKEKDVWFLTLEDKEYPELLKGIKNPPYVLYGKGQVPAGA